MIFKSRKKRIAELEAEIKRLNEIPNVPTRIVMNEYGTILLEASYVIERRDEPYIDEEMITELLGRELASQIRQYMEIVCEDDIRYPFKKIVGRIRICQIK